MRLNIYLRPSGASGEVKVTGAYTFNREESDRLKSDFQAYLDRGAKHDSPKGGVYKCEAEYRGEIFLFLNFDDIMMIG